MRTEKDSKSEIYDKINTLLKNKAYEDDIKKTNQVVKISNYCQYTSKKINFKNELFEIRHSHYEVYIFKLNRNIFQNTKRRMK